jgi:hypothetical protein
MARADGSGWRARQLAVLGRVFKATDPSVRDSIFCLQVARREDTRLATET